MSATLEWLAFAAALLCVFCYGHSKFHGAVVGVATALLFIAWGVVASVAAAAVTNVVFLGLHIRNLRRALRERRADADL